MKILIFISVFILISCKTRSYNSETEGTIVNENQKWFFGLFGTDTTNRLWAYIDPNRQDRQCWYESVADSNFGSGASMGLFLKSNAVVPHYIQHSAMQNSIRSSTELAAFAKAGHMLWAGGKNGVYCIASATAAGAAYAGASLIPEGPVGVAFGGMVGGISGLTIGTMISPFCAFYAAGTEASYLDSLNKETTNAINTALSEDKDLQYKLEPKAYSNLISALRNAYASTSDRSVENSCPRPTEKMWSVKNSQIR